MDKQHRSPRDTHTSHHPTHNTTSSRPTNRPTHSTASPRPTNHPTHNTTSPRPTNRPTHNTTSPRPTNRSARETLPAHDTWSDHPSPHEKSPVRETQTHYHSPRGTAPVRDGTTPVRDAPSFDSDADGMIEGRNAVMEAIRAGVRIDKIYLRKGEPDAALGYIASTARAAGTVVVEADRRKLDAMSRTHAHQGVIAVCAVREYVDVERLLQTAADRGEPPLLVICDSITDPHNLGAIIRTAECAGAHGMILPKRRSAGLTAIVGKTSAGAVAHMDTARVGNLASTLRDLKKRGVWIFGADPAGTVPLWRTDLTVPAAIVIGSEGNGMGRLTAENCDVTVQIPMRGKLNSLNASTAAALMLYEAVRQRGFG